MSIALVDHKIAGGSATNTTTSAAMNSTNANFLSVGYNFYNVLNIPALSDSKGNTFTTTLSVEHSDTALTQGFYYASGTPVVGSSHTFTLSAALACYPSISPAAFSGVKTTSPIDQQNNNKTASSTTLAVGSVTPSEDNELLLACCADSWTGTVTVNAGSMLDQLAAVGGFSYALATAYEIQTTATVRNLTFSYSPAARTGGTVVTVKAAAAGSAIKTINGLVAASVKTINGLAIASMKTRNGLT